MKGVCSMSLGDIFSGYIEEDLRIRKTEADDEKLKAEKEADRLQRIEDQKMMYTWTSNFNNRQNAQTTYDESYKSNKQIISNMIADLDGNVPSVNYLIQKQGFEGAQTTIAELKAASKRTSGIRSSTSYLPSQIVELIRQEGRTPVTIEQLTNFVTYSPSILEIEPTTLTSVGEVENLEIDRLTLDEPELAKQSPYYRDMGLIAYKKATTMEEGPEQDAQFAKANMLKGLAIMSKNALDYDANPIEFSSNDYEKFNNVIISLLASEHSPNKRGEWAGNGETFTLKGMEATQTSELNKVATYLTNQAAAAIASGESYATVKSRIVDFVMTNETPQFNMFESSDTDNPFGTKLGGTFTLVTNEGNRKPLLNANLFPDSKFNPNRNPEDNTNTTTVPNGNGTSLMDTLMRDYNNARTPSERRAIIEKMKRQAPNIKDPWLELGNIIPTN